MAHTVIGFFSSSSDAYKAAEKLKNNGFDNDKIDVSPNYTENERMEYENVSSSTASGEYGSSSSYGTIQSFSSDRENRDKNEEGTGSKIANFFKSMFSSDDDEANRYTNAANYHSVVTVHTFSEEEAKRAADILDDSGAVDVDERNIDMSDDASNSYTRRESSISSEKDYNQATEASIPIIEEQVNIGKKEVQRGGVKVKSRIIEKPVEETLRLREERVRVERNPVNRDATEADFNSFQEGTVEINEYGEEPIVSKKARVVEEVNVGVDAEERKETVKDTERRTEVEVEDFAKSSR